jgi:hypothetical protein
MLFYLRPTLSCITYENTCFVLVRRVRNFLLWKWKVWMSCKWCLFVLLVNYSVFFLPAFCLARSSTFSFFVPLFLHLLSIVLLPAFLPYFLLYILLLQFLYVNAFAPESHHFVVSLKPYELGDIHIHNTDCFITHCEHVDNSHSSNSK